MTVSVPMYSRDRMHDTVTMDLFSILGMSHLSNSLRSESEKYRRAARNINFSAMIRQYAPLGAMLFIIIVLLWWRFT